MNGLKEMIALAQSKLAVHEVWLLIGMLDSALKYGGGRHTDFNIAQLVKDETPSAAYKVLVMYTHSQSRELSHCSFAARKVALVRSLLHLREKLVANLLTRPPGDVVAAPAEGVCDDLSLRTGIIKTYQISVGRSPDAAEIAAWQTHFANGLPFHEFFLSLQTSSEARQYSSAQIKPMQSESDGKFVQMAYELLMQRGAKAWEIALYLAKLEEGSLTRAGMVEILMESASQFFQSQIAPMPNDGLSCWVMGTNVTVSATDWAGQAQKIREALPLPPPTSRYANTFHIKSEPRILVSALASMYCGGEFIEQFMDNITSQDGFDEFCELIIVDADSPENEYETIKRYLRRHKNINYIRCNSRIGIYDAWNLAAKAARGDYLTNTNMDDLRRHDSFQIQAATLDNLPFVDVVYQDLYYTFDPQLSFSEIATFGLQTALPVITPHNLLQFNSPHNAPMWRKRLHDELGYFDTHYKSAGDYEFWMRCMAAGKKFYKTNDPHVVYYQNPRGLSTRPGTHGIAEGMEIHRAYCRKLISDDVVMSRKEFICKLGSGNVGLVSGGNNDRYLLAQQALRHAARNQKYNAMQGARP